MGGDRADLLLRGGTIIDGTGGPAYQADLAVADGRIAALGEALDLAAARVIDADGLVIAPGFIDLHTHSDLQLLANPAHEPKVRQGVTCEVIGHDGLSYAPVTEPALRYLVEQCAPLNGAPDLDYSWRTAGEFLDRFDRRVPVNVALLVPHGAVRASVLGQADRPATPAELERMAALVDGAMRDGAVGFATGLTYAPCSFGDTAELIALCAASARWGGVFMPHLRSYGTGVVAAHDEALAIARASGIALHFTHHQVVFDCNRDRHRWYTDILDDAAAEGLDVTCDSYPYAAGSTFLIGFFPSWAQGRGRTAVLDLLRDETASERLRREIEIDGCDGGHGVPLDWTRLQLSGVAADTWRPQLGRRLDAIATERGLSPWALARLLLLENDGQVNVVGFFGHEHAVRHVMQHPRHMVGSDGILVGDNPHPRVFGTFPRYLGHYCRDEGLFDLPTCIRKMTGAGAARLGLRHRGEIHLGWHADLTLFDPATIRDEATFERPRAYPTGIPYVMVNGELTVDEGERTSAVPGRAVRRADANP